jgi:hypothetical protein
MNVQPRASRIAVHIFWELRDEIKRHQRPGERFWQACDRIIRLGLQADKAKAAT